MEDSRGSRKVKKKLKVVKRASDEVCDCRIDKSGISEPIAEADDLTKEQKDQLMSLQRIWIEDMRKNNAGECSTSNEKKDPIESVEPTEEKDSELMKLKPSPIDELDGLTPELSKERERIKSVIMELLDKQNEFIKTFLKEEIGRSFSYLNAELQKKKR